MPKPSPRLGNTTPSPPGRAPARRHAGTQPRWRTRSRPRRVGGPPQAVAARRRRRPRAPATLAAGSARAPRAAARGSCAATAWPGSSSHGAARQVEPASARRRRPGPGEALVVEPGVDREHALRRDAEPADDPARASARSRVTTRVRAPRRARRRPGAGRRAPRRGKNSGSSRCRTSWSVTTDGPPRRAGSARSPGVDQVGLRREPSRRGGRPRHAAEQASRAPGASVARPVGAHRLDRHPAAGEAQLRPSRPVRQHGHALRAGAAGVLARAARGRRSPSRPRGPGRASGG